MYEGRIFYDRIGSDGREFSAYALRPAKALNEESWIKAKLVRPALVREGGSVEFLDSFGAAVRDGKLCVLIGRLSSSEALTELGLEGLGRALAALAAAYARGGLDPAEVDLTSLRSSGDAFVLLTGGAGLAASATSPGSGRRGSEPAGALAALREQRRAIASLMRGRLSPDPAGGFVPRARSDGRIMAPALRAFLAGRQASPMRVGAVRRELSLWAEAAAAVGEAPFRVGDARDVALARACDALERRFRRAEGWAGRRRPALAAAALTLALAAAVGGPMAWRRFGPPLSAGLSAEELAERYLGALAALDLPFIDSVVRAPAALPYAQDLYALAAMSAVRRGMNETPLWEITAASVARFEPEGEANARAELRYELRIGEELFTRHDALSLTLRRGHWLIIGHEEIGASFVP